MAIKSELRELLHMSPTPISNNLKDLSESDFDIREQNTSSRLSESTDAPPIESKRETHLHVFLPKGVVDETKRFWRHDNFKFSSATVQHFRLETFVVEALYAISERLLLEGIHITFLNIAESRELAQQFSIVASPGIGIWNENLEEKTISSDESPQGKDTLHLDKPPTLIERAWRWLNGENWSAGGTYLPFLEREFIQAFSAKQFEGETNPASEFLIFLQELQRVNAESSIQEVWNRIDKERSKLKLTKAIKIISAFKY